MAKKADRKHLFLTTIQPIIVVAFLLFSTAAFANKQDNISYQVSLGSEYFLWEEYIDNTLILYEQGMRIRIGGQAFHHSSQNKHGITAHAYLGRPDYNGQDQSGNLAYSVVDYSGFVVNFIAQHTLASRQLAIHALLGTEYWWRSIHDTTNVNGDAVSGALEIYTVFHSGLGVTLQTNNNIKIDLTLKMPLGIYEYVDVFDSYIKPEPLPSLSASITRNLNIKQATYYIRSYFDSLLMAPSNNACGGSPITCFYQPESRAYTVGIEVGRKI